MIVIKDMEMPKSCSECGLKSGNYCYHKKPPYDLNSIDVLKEKASNCPLVEIVTCKDCKYYREDDDTGHCTNHTCGDIVFWCHADYYCADAERKK